MLKLIKRIKKFILNREKLKYAAIAAFSSAKVYADVMPFGLPACFVLDNSPVGILIYVAVMVFAGTGFSSYLRHIFALIIYKISEKILKDRVPEFIIMGCSVLLGGAVSLLLLNEKRWMMFSFAAQEAVISSVFIFVLRKAKEVVREKKRGEITTESELAFPLISCMAMCLAFSDLELGRISVSCVLLLLIGMASAYKYKAPVSAVINMAMSFFCLSFTPENTAVSVYLILSGFCASILKNYGKFLIPCTYLAFLPLFSNMRVNITSIYIEDVFMAALLFLVIPGKFFSFMDVIPYTDGEGVPGIKLHEKVNIVADAFYSISEIFSGFPLRIYDNEEKDASKLTVEKVCRDCVFKGRCSEEAERVLRSYSTDKGRIWEKELTCARRRELLSAFSGNFRVLRMENMWDSHIKEANEAVSEEMVCIADMLKKIASEKDMNLRRDEASENELKTALKKRGIGVKGLIAGKNSDGLFNVIIDPVKMKAIADYEDYFSGIIKDTLGVDAIRYGVEPRYSGKVFFSETPSLKIEKSVSSDSVEKVSGDSVAFSYIDEGHFAIVLSDGMGTGVKAGSKSKAASELSVKLLAAGMNIRSALGMVNALLLRQGGKDFVTLDMAVINLETGEVEMSKNASASSYILTCGGKVIPLDISGSPLGIIGKVESGLKKYRIAEGDFLIMVSDGVADCFSEKDTLAEKIEAFIPGSVENLTDYIMAQAKARSGNGLNDDMTVIAVGCIKKQKSGKAKEKGGLVYEKRQKSDYFR